jgi:hypothetical protein
MNIVSIQSLNQRPLSRLPTKLVNAPLTMSRACVVGLDRDPPFWHCAAMAKRNARAGGIFLMIGILGGAAWGIARGEPMLGVLAGTGAGIAAAVLLWLLDLRR